MKKKARRGTSNKSSRARSRSKKGYESEKEVETPQQQVMSEDEEDLLYSKESLIAFKDTSADLKFNIGMVRESMKVDDKEAKVYLWQLVDEKGLRFEPLDPKSRTGTVDSGLIIGEVSFKKKGFDPEGGGNLLKKEFNRIVKRMEEMPMTDSETDEEDNELTQTQVKASQAGKRKLSKSPIRATQKGKKKTPKKPTVFKKGKWNPDVEVEESNFELEYKKTEVWTCCCHRCSSRNVMRAAVTQDIKLLEECFKDKDHVPTLNQQ